jgi:O-antigen ligase
MRLQGKIVQFQHALTAGSVFVALLVTTQSNSDPVNVSKLAALGVLGGLTLGELFRVNIARVFSQQRFLVSILIAFVVNLFFAGFSSVAPFSQSFYGVFGRNNGILTYSLLAIILLGTSTLNEVKSVRLLINGFLIVGAVNVIYCGWVLIFGDFIGWQNPYKHILGTFGNPDFISAFLGIFIACCLSLLFSKTLSRIQKLSLGIFSLFALYEILASKAIQGLVIVALAFLVVGLFFVRNKFESIWPSVVYIFLASIIGILAVLGTLQKGPWVFLYKKSVSLRGSYWHAGLQMGLNHPITGVGPDSYGDWYRRTRPPIALIDTPSINTMSNVSHNVFIDFFAWGGFPLLLMYVTISMVGIVLIIKRFISFRSYDPIFVALAASWICYQAQSIISINQIGLALWGWILLGLLIAYDRVSSEIQKVKPQNSRNVRSESRNRKEKSGGFLSIFAILGSVCGFLIAVPPLLADAKWQTALKQRNLQQVEESMKPSYFNPPNSSKYANAVNLLLVNKLQDKAITLGTAAVQFNRNSFDSWRQLYFITGENDPLHTKALANMKRLDPLNPDVTTP